MDEEPIYLYVGGISAFQWDLTRAEQEELEERLRRRKPCGFAAWPDQQPESEPVPVKPRSRRGGKR